PDASQPRQLYPQFLPKLLQWRELLRRASCRLMHCSKREHYSITRRTITQPTPAAPETGVNLRRKHPTAPVASHDFLSQANPGWPTSKRSGFGRLGASACFVDLHAAQRGSHDGGLDAQLVGAASEVPDNMLAFGWAPVLDIC